MYEIIDEKGVIYSSNNEEEIYGFWEEMVGDNPENGEDAIGWTGDLKLVNILEIFR